MADKAILKQEIIRQIQALVKANDGVVPGYQKFEVTTGIRNHEWRGKIWRSWSDALEEAGFSANKFSARLDADPLLEAVSKLALRKGKFPTSGDLLFESSNVSGFPRAKTILARWNMRELADALKDYSVKNKLTDVISLCNDYLEKNPPKVIEEDTETEKLGYVYLIRYERHFKIGRTTSLVRRSRQVQIELPNETLLVHSILTDDPVGVEAYWHKRFADRRGNGEWFNLSKADIAAFCKWKKIS